MKNLKLIPVLFAFTLVLFNCSNDDDNTTETPPPPIVEEEVITTLRIVLTPTTGPDVTLQTQDLDVDGPNPPVITVSGNLAANTTYTGVIAVLNETEDPAEDITEEIEVDEADEHQFFFIPGGGLDVTTEYTNFDANNNPVGTKFNLTTTTTGSGTLTITLRHEPTKPNDGTLEGAGGETDIEAAFPIVVE